MFLLGMKQFVILKFKENHCIHSYFCRMREKQEGYPEWKKAGLLKLVY